MIRIPCCCRAFGIARRMAASRAILVCLLIGLCVDSASAVAQTKTTAQDPRVGTKVLVTKAGAELRTPKATVWRAYLGEVFTVSLTNGEWLWVTEKSGWLWEKETIPFASSIDELSKRVSSMPTAENYHLRGGPFENYRRLIFSSVDEQIALQFERFHRLTFHRSYT